MTRRRTKLDKEFECLDCNLNCDSLNEYFMLKDWVWWQARYQGPPPNLIEVPNLHGRKTLVNFTLDGDGMLCVGCVEKRLGRRLRASDFQDIPLNRGEVFEQSQRLKHRVQRYKRREKPNPISVWFDAGFRVIGPP